MGAKTRRRYHYPVPRRHFSIHITLYRRPEYLRGSLIGYVYHRGKRLKVSLGHHHIWPEHWDHERQRMLVGVPCWQEINSSIDTWIGKIVTYFSTRSELGNEPTIGGLRAYLMPSYAPAAPEDSEGTIVWWFGRFIRGHSNNGRPLAAGTRQTYKVVLTSWRAFERFKQHRYTLQELMRDDHGDTLVGKTIIQEYQRYLRDGSANGRRCSDNTVRKYLKIINTFIRWCEGQTGKQLLRSIALQGEASAKHTFALTQQDVQQLEALELPEGSRLDAVRDAMLMAIYTGLRHSEWLKVRPELWREPSQLITSQKTGKVCLVVHREPLRRILMKYQEHGFRRTIHSLQKMNTYVKDVAKRAGLNRPVSRIKTIDGVEEHETVPLHAAITTHTFRRTKITMELNQGRTLRDIVMETGQDEMVARKHYDRPDLEEHVRKMGVHRVIEA